MAILLDPPRWPAHGTIFGHLVSDLSLDELHAFAANCELPPQAFDHDHYDVPESRYERLLAAGAVLVRERDLVRRLAASGLRVRAWQKTPTREQARTQLLADWESYGLPSPLRDDLLRRWAEPHRHYHDTRHLASCLAALDRLGGAHHTVRLAAWFHDAVYAGQPGADEEASAALAEAKLLGLLPADEIAEVERLVRMTSTHQPQDEAAALLSDADLSVLGQPPGRYDVYLRDVRLDYAHLDEPTWRQGRLRVLEQLLSAAPLFHTREGRDLWEAQAGANLRAERLRLTTGTTSGGWPAI